MRVRSPPGLSRSFLGVALLLGCGTSGNAAATDSGSNADSAQADAAGQCNPFGAPTCPPGKTCCFAGVKGTCTDLGACSSSVQFECDGPSRCDAGDVCCGTVPGPDASAILISFLGSLDGGLPDHWPPGITATAFCAPACSAPNAPLCQNRADCRGSATCEPVPEGNVVLTAIGAETLAVCSIPDAGAAPSDAGSSQVSDASTDAADAPTGD
jgi:hypothetical protein